MHVFDLRWCLHAIPLAALIAVALAPSSGAAGEARAPGFHGWTFGMGPDEVKKVGECARYLPVAATGGLECPDFKLDGRTMNISFVFGPSGLAKIQLWAYEGKEVAKAVEALDWALSWYRRTYGELESPSMPEANTADLRALAKWVAANDKPGAAAFKAQFSTKARPSQHFTFASLIHDTTHGYYVFVYFQPPR